MTDPWDRGAEADDRPAVEAPRRPARSRALLWALGAYRAWSLGVFALAVLHLALIGDLGSYFLCFVVVSPFAAALALSYHTRAATSRWLIVYLLLVDLGVIIGPEHDFLPMLHRFPGLPQTSSRILTWYLVVYFGLQWVALPPVALGRSLRTAWRGGKPALAPWISVLGLAAWGLLMTILALGAIHELG